MTTTIERLEDAINKAIQEDVGATTEGAFLLATAGEALGVLKWMADVENSMKEE